MNGNDLGDFEQMRRRIEECDQEALGDVYRTFSDGVIAFVRHGLISVGPEREGIHTPEELANEGWMRFKTRGVNSIRGGWGAVVRFVGRTALNYLFDQLRGERRDVHPKPTGGDQSSDSEEEGADKQSGPDEIEAFLFDLANRRYRRNVGPVDEQLIQAKEQLIREETDEERQRAIVMVLNQETRRNQEIIQRRYGLGGRARETAGEIANDFDDLTENAVHQITTRFRRRVRESQNPHEGTPQ